MIALDDKLYKNKEWLKEHYENYGCSYISKLCNVDEKTILYWLKKFNIKIRSRSESLKLSKANHHFVNENYFKVIDDPHKAYWLGFLMADGTMREYKENCYQLSFELKSNDSYIIEQFNKDIESSYSIINDGMRSRLIITNSNFCKPLIELGIMPYKTGKEHFPNIPNEYKRDFIRGFFDGDGSIIFSKKNRTRCRFHIVSCSFDILKDIMKNLPANFTEKSLHCKTNASHIYELELSTLPEIAKIYDYLYYDNCICLKRKEDIFKNFLEEYKKSKLLIKRYSPTH